MMLIYLSLWKIDTQEELERETKNLKKKKLKFIFEDEEELEEFIDTVLEVEEFLEEFEK